MRAIPLPATRRRSATTAWLLLLLTTMLSPALAQSRLERSGVTLYWGLVPAAVVADKHALADLHGGPRVGTTGVPQFQPARIPAHRQQFHLRGVSRRPGILVQAAVGVDERLGELLVDARAGGQRQQQRQPCRVADRASPLPAAGPVFHCAPRIGCNAGLQDSAGAGSHAPPPHGAQPQAMRASSQAQAGNVARHSTMP